jgi:hypothetical protein
LTTDLRAHCFHKVSNEPELLGGIGGGGALTEQADQLPDLSARRVR